MTAADQEDVHRTIERIARESYGRLVAYLSSHTRDVAGAEDALSEALIAALNGGTIMDRRKRRPRFLESQAAGSDLPKSGGSANLSPSHDQEN